MAGLPATTWTSAPPESRMPTPGRATAARGRADDPRAGAAWSGCRFGMGRPARQILALQIFVDLTMLELSPVRLVYVADVADEQIAGNVPDLPFPADSCAIAGRPIALVGSDLGVSTPTARCLVCDATYNGDDRERCAATLARSHGFRPDSRRVRGEGRDWGHRMGAIVPISKCDGRRSNSGDRWVPQAGNSLPSAVPQARAISLCCTERCAAWQCSVAAGCRLGRERRMAWAVRPPTGSPRSIERIAMLLVGDSGGTKTTARSSRPRPGRARPARSGSSAVPSIRASSP